MFSRNKFKCIDNPNSLYNIKKRSKNMENYIRKCKNMKNYL